jgi:hypothetical protein
MIDKELLELAAKAEGHSIEFTKDGLCWMDSKFTSLLWNPLHHDGDALRLAVKLGISIDFPDCGVWIRIGGINGILIQEYWDDDSDLLNGTRRAIVRAAAEIGKAMP